MLFDEFPSIPDLERRARSKLPRFAWDYLAGGAGDEKGVQRNRDAYDAVCLTPDYLCERRPVATQARLFGRDYHQPFGIAPIGQSGLIWPRAAEFLAAAAKKADIPFCLSMLATSSIEEIGAIAGPNAWFQLYPLKDLGVTRDVLDRAKAAGFSTLIVTVDTPAGRRTLRDQRNGLTVPPRLSLTNIARMFGHPGWLAATAAHGMPRFETLRPYFPPDADITGVGAITQMLGAKGMDAKRLAEVRKLWQGPMLVKGTLGLNDARDARRIGIEGLILSNHGGRQSEALQNPLQVLRQVRDAVGRDLTVGVDSGVRSGLDVARAMALGAEFVLLGRAFMFAVAALGRAGADHAVDLLSIELQQAMGQMGCFELKDLPHHLAG